MKSKSRSTRKPRTSVPAAEASRSTGFCKWLQKQFGLDDFRAAIITRKAEEMFRDPKKEPLAQLADELLRHAE